VALYINKIWDAVVTAHPEIQILMQVHDSLVWQALTSQFQTAKVNFAATAKTIIIPYPDPLIIPVGFKSSTSSWGDCH
jgi:hypothetical protein